MTNEIAFGEVHSCLSAMNSEPKEFKEPTSEEKSEKTLLKILNAQENLLKKKKKKTTVIKKIHGHTIKCYYVVSK